MAAYNRGDYVPAIRLFRPLAEAGNSKAQSVIGVMYRKGEGVALWVGQDRQTSTTRHLPPCGGGSAARRHCA